MKANAKLCKPVFTPAVERMLGALVDGAEAWRLLRWYAEQQREMVRVADGLAGYGGAPTPDELASAIDTAPEPPPPDCLSDPARAMLPALRGEAQDLVEAFYLEVLGRKRRRKNPENSENSRNPENSRNAENPENSGNSENPENSFQKKISPAPPFQENCSQSDKQRANAHTRTRTDDDGPTPLEAYERAGEAAGLSGDELRRFVSYNAGKGSIPPEEAVRRWTARRTATEAAGGPAAVSARRAALSARAARERGAQDADRRARASESNVAKILRLAEERGAKTPEDLDAIGALPEVDAFFGEVIEAKRRWKELHP